MRKFVRPELFLLLFCLPGMAAEHYLQAYPANSEQATWLKTHLVLDHGQGSRPPWKAYANDRQLRSLQKSGIKWQPLQHPGDNPAAITSPLAKNLAINTYPSYPAYVAMMENWASTYPDIVRLHEIGLSQEGRKLLALEITDLPDSNEAEPEVLLTSTMHGDETTGFILLLKLVDELLSQYNQDIEITRLVNRMEIWINPLANPDGTYFGGDHTVSQARRFLANGVDANRNFPDAVTGENPDGHAYAPETLAMMTLAAERNFNLSINIHGGAEVVNYPWDNRPELHPDDTWLKTISREYADLAQANWPQTRAYMSQYDNGITNGYAWYETHGSRQDYMSYYLGSREVTLEISNEKNPAASSLNDYWLANRDALLAYIMQADQGLRIRVTDTRGVPLPDVLMTIEGRDSELAASYSDDQTGDLFRLLMPGTYNITLSKPCYHDYSIPKISVNAGQLTLMQVQMYDHDQLHYSGFEKSEPSSCPQL